MKKRNRIFSAMELYIDALRQKVNKPIGAEIRSVSPCPQTNSNKGVRSRRRRSAKRKALGIAQ